MLECFVREAVLRAIEKLDQPRENINFQDLCNSSTELFGEAGVSPGHIWDTDPVPRHPWCQHDVIRHRHASAIKAFGH